MSNHCQRQRGRTAYTIDFDESARGIHLDTAEGISEASHCVVLTHHFDKDHAFQRDTLDMSTNPVYRTPSAPPRNVVTISHVHKTLVGSGFKSSTT